MIIKELEHKSNLAEDDISEMKSDLEAARMNLHLSNGRVKKNSESIKEIEEKLKNLGSATPVATPVTEAAPVKMEIPEGANIDVNQLQSLFASKDALANLERRLAACESTNVNQNESLDNHESRISELEK